jgi:4a-hydroxytetrahydrobiopterin dehydratase
MESLAQERCVACRRDAPRVTAEELSALKPRLPDWTVTEPEGVPAARTHLPLSLTSPGHSPSLSASVSLPRRKGHHPAILTEWGRVTVSWWTHKIRGLHRNDFVMAAKTDRLAALDEFRPD